MEYIGLFGVLLIALVAWLFYAITPGRKGIMAMKKRLLVLKWLYPIAWLIIGTIAIILIATMLSMMMQFDSNELIDGYVPVIGAGFTFAVVIIAAKITLLHYLNNAIIGCHVANLKLDAKKNKAVGTVSISGIYFPCEVYGEQLDWHSSSFHPLPYLVQNARFDGRMMHVEIIEQITI